MQRSPFRLSLTSAVLFVLLAACAAAQRPYVPDSLWVTLDDSSRIARRTSKKVIFPAEHWCAGYEYQMYADSTCETDFTVTAFKVNGHRWKLRNWKSDRTVNTDAAVLTANSRTIDTALVAGDTISFYREMKWRNPLDGVTGRNNYKSFDTLTCAVELVRATDGVRVALLDSIGVLPQPITGVPSIHGTLPIMMWRKWVVPGWLDGVPVFLRVRMTAGGTGDYDFTRRETPSAALWRRLEDPDWIFYLNYLGQIYTKPTVMPAGPAASTSLNVRLSPGMSDAIDIDFSTAANGEPTALAIHDGMGRLVFVPYSRPSTDGGTERIHYQFESSGLYLVSLMHANTIVASTKITIGK